MRRRYKRELLAFTGVACPASDGTVPPDAIWTSIAGWHRNAVPEGQARAQALYVRLCCACASLLGMQTIIVRQGASASDSTEWHVSWATFAQKGKRHCTDGRALLRASAAGAFVTSLQLQHRALDLQLGSADERPCLGAETHDAGPGHASHPPLHTRGGRPRQKAA